MKQINDLESAYTLLLSILNKLPEDTPVDDYVEVVREMIPLAIQEFKVTEFDSLVFNPLFKKAMTEDKSHKDLYDLVSSFALQSLKDFEVLIKNKSLDKFSFK